MKTLFLDIDGVLNRMTQPGRRVRRIYFTDCPDPRFRGTAYLEERQLKRFRDWFQAADKSFGRIQIIVSSSWRDFFPESQEEPLYKFLSASAGIPLDRFIGSTPRGDFADRTFQIRSCMQDNGIPLENAIILDDQDQIFDGNDPVFTRLIKTEGSRGFTVRDKQRAMMLLGENLAKEKPRLRNDQIWQVQRAGMMACHGLLTPEKVLQIGRNQGMSPSRVVFLLKIARDKTSRLAEIADRIASGA